VNSLLAGGSAAVQRRIDITPFQLAIRGSLNDRTYVRIIEALRGVLDAPSIFNAGFLRGLCEKWLAENESPTTPQLTAAKSLIEDLHMQADREVGILRAEKIYLQDFAGGKLAGATESTTFAAAGPAKDLAAGEKVGGPGGGQEALDLISRVKLSAAELAAIRAYSTGDYKYLNPATANNPDWLAQNIEKEKEEDVRGFNTDAKPKDLMSEGAMHAGVLMSAMAKLPAWPGEDAYRGTRMTQAAFDAKYAKGAIVPYNAFTSAAKAPEPAQKFADGIGGSPPAPGEDVSVFLEIKVTNARDISSLSLVTVEKEVLLLPGAKLKVLDVIPVTGVPGSTDVPATKWYVVKLVQES